MPLYSFYCPDCEVLSDEIFKVGERPGSIICHICHHEAKYVMSAPSQFRISVEGNGRKGYKTDMGNGRKTVRSETRERYEHRLGNTPAAEIKKNPNALTESAYTKRYAEKVGAEKKAKDAHTMRMFKKAIKGE